MIKGKYNFGDTAFVDCNYSYNDMSNKIHEYMHKKLTTSTLFGIVNFMLANSTNENLIKISTTFKKSSTIVNENYALFYQLAFMKKFDEKNYNEFVKKFRYSEYYDAYYGKRILSILSKSDIESLIRSRIVERIAFLSMNINFYEFDSTKLIDDNYIRSCIINNSYKFSPDKRYIKMLKILDELLGKYNISEITDEMLLKKGNINVIDNSKENFLKILVLYKKQFIKKNVDINIIEENINRVERISEDEFILLNVGEEDIYNIFDIVRPMSINFNYTTYTPTSIKRKHIECNVLRVMIDNEKFSYAIIIFLDVVQGNEYIFRVSKAVLINILSRYKNSILIFYEDYKVIIKDIPFLKRKSMFLEIDNSYNICKNYISKDMSINKEVMIHQLNNAVFFLFVKQNKGHIFVMRFLSEIFKLVKKDIDEGFFNLIQLDENNLDGCFYRGDTDWYKYEDIIRSIAKTYILDVDNKFDTLGHRVY